MKFKTQKEVKEEAQDENKSNPIHEYLDVAFQFRVQFEAIKHLFEPIKNILRVGMDWDNYMFEKLFKYYKHSSTKKCLIKYTHDSADAIECIYNNMHDLFELYNEIHSKLNPIDQYLISSTLPIKSDILEIVEIYQDFQEDPDKAKKKYCKCE